MQQTHLLSLSSGIRDNHSRGSIGAFLQQKLQSGCQFSVVSAYFTIYAFAALQDELQDIQNLRFLFGEPRFLRSLDPEKTDRKSFKIEDEGLQLANRLEQKQTAKACAQWIQDKVDIRSVRKSNFLHGKMYHISHNGVADAILGSSNFTVHGLGLGTTGNNIELNLEVDSNRDRQDLRAWFDELWHDDELVKDVKAQVLLYLSQLYQNHSPEFIYFKTLYHLFERFLDDQERASLLQEQSHIADTQIWNELFQFQKDGVKGAINKMQAHGGCIIADSVGLGKTYEALAIIKYFELMNDRILVLCPKKLRENWAVYLDTSNSTLNPFAADRFRYTVLSHTDLSRDSGRVGDTDLATFNWGAYDLVVIDESHNFRNNTRGRHDEEGRVIRKSRYERLMEDVLQGGVKTKVLLLSATPVNNDLKDLRNQLHLITEGDDNAFQDRDSSLGVASIRSTLANAQREFTLWARGASRDSRQLLERLNAAFFTLLDGLTIARSRQHIQSYYPETIQELGGFPVRLKPVAVTVEVDNKGKFPSYGTLNTQISQYRLALFNPSRYVQQEHQALYEERDAANFTQSDRENHLIGMMKVNFLKRLESSVHSFKTTLERTIEKIQQLEARIERFQQFQEENPELDLSELDIDALGDEELEQAMQVGKAISFRMAHLDLGQWQEDLRADRDQLHLVHRAAKNVTVERDAKLAELKRLIRHKVNQPTVNRNGKPNRKVIVFTAFADTATYLYESLEPWVRGKLDIHMALVTGSTGRCTLGRSDFHHILTNFSPISKTRSRVPGMPDNEEIDLLIATDCVSEGQNLQDCDYLINYDIHWNPVRIIQRFGRIDRIGSLNNTVQLVNFWPTHDLNQYINLRNRVEARMALVDITATQGDNLLAPNEIQQIAEDELNYRDQQLLRLKDEILDLEDFSETVALNEFTLDDFRIELSRYIESNRALLRDAPLGLYTVVPINPDYPQIAPGVIFCLQQKTESTENQSVNPLQPYYLVYVRDDKTIRYTFAQPKQILEIFRLLCAEKPAPYDQLCDLFDQHTSDGHDMSVHTELLDTAVRSITKTYQKRALRNLLSGRGGRLAKQDEQVHNTTDFELITWLVIDDRDA